MKVKNVSPLGELDVLLLGRTVAAGEVVEVTTKQAAELYKLVDRDNVLHRMIPWIPRRP